MLRLICSSDRDSVVLLIGAESLEVVQSKYVRAGDTVELTGVAPGTYWVRVTQGRMWDDGLGRFRSSPSYFRFPHTYTFDEKDVGDSIEYVRLSLTLNEVHDGNVQVVRIPQEGF